MARKGFAVALIWKKSRRRSCKLNNSVSRLIVTCMRSQSPWKMTRNETPVDSAGKVGEWFQSGCILHSTGLGTAAMPGLKTVVENLAAAGIKLGIVTSTSREQVGFKLKKLKKLKQNNTLGYFEAIVTSSDVARKKPAPDPMAECCRQLDVKLENSVYIGDSRSDIQSGRSAGMKTIAVLSGFDDLRALSREFPDAVLDSVAELGTLID